MMLLALRIPRRACSLRDGCSTMKCTSSYTCARTAHSQDDARYNFMQDPRKVGATVILTADETTYSGAYVRFPGCSSIQTHLRLRRTEV